MITVGRHNRQADITLLFQYICICLCYIVMSAVVTCWERADLLALLYVKFIVTLTKTVSWIRYGTDCSDS